MAKQQKRMTVRPDTRSYPHASAVTPSIWWVGRSSWGNLPPLTNNGDCNIWLLKGRQFDVLIDAGIGEPGKLDQRLREAGSAPERIREIWLTHTHYDHFQGACAWARKRPHTLLRVPRISLQFIRRRDYRLIGLNFSGSNQRLVRPKRLVAYAPGGVLRCPPWSLKTLALPGHVLDHGGFRGQVDGLDTFFSGDAVIGDQGPVRGNVGWLDGYWLSSVRTYEETLKNLAKDPPGFFLPGHGVPHAGPSARRSLKNCLWRVQQMAAIPHLGTMVPFA